MKAKDTLKKLISIESVAESGTVEYPYGKGPARALDYMLDICEGFGFRTKNADYKYAYAEIGEGKELIAILCHLDVVPAGNDWNYPPFQGTEADGRIYGRGAIDDKGPAVASVYAMKDLLESDITLNKRIRIIFGQTEENGDWIDIEEYKKSEEIPECGFTPDSSFPAIYGEKGILLLKVKMSLVDGGISFIKGGRAPNMVADKCEAVVGGKRYKFLGCSAHGSTPWEGDNAITKMMEKVYHENKKCVFAKMYMEMFGWNHHGEHAGCEFYDSESGKLSLNPGLIETDDEELVLWLDIRYPVTYSLNDVLDGLKKKAESYGAKVEISYHMKKVLHNKDGPQMQALLSAYREVKGDFSEPCLSGGGSYARAMDNIVAFGPLMPGQENTEHKADEYIKINNLNKLRLIYRKALGNLMEI